jgi:hypothetical protein
MRILIATEELAAAELGAMELSEELDTIRDAELSEEEVVDEAALERIEPRLEVDGFLSEPPPPHAVRLTKTTMKKICFIALKKPKHNQ